MGAWSPVWPDWAIYWTLGIFLKPCTTINLPKSPKILGNFCKGVKIFNFSRNIIFGELLRTFVDFFWSHWYLPFYMFDFLIGLVILRAREMMSQNTSMNVTKLMPMQRPRRPPIWAENSTQVCLGSLRPNSKPFFAVTDYVLNYWCMI